MILKWRQHQNCGGGSEFQGRLMREIDFACSGCVCARACVCGRVGGLRSHVDLVFDGDAVCVPVFLLQLTTKLEATPN